MAILKVLTISLTPSCISVIVTPLLPDIRVSEVGLNHVIFGLGTPEAVQVKETAPGAVTVTSSGGLVMLAATAWIEE